MAGHKPPILWSPEALNDIDHLWDYYARVAGRATADKIMREIATVLPLLTTFLLLAGRVTKFGQVCARSPLLPKLFSIV